MATQEFTKVRFYKPLAKASRESRHLTVKTGDATRPSTTFTQPDRMEGVDADGVERPDASGQKEVVAFVLILRTRGCRWALGGGCTFCGYVNDSFIRKIEPHELVEQMRNGLKEYKGEPVFKIYTSGSFLDPYEVDEDAQVEIAKLVPATVKKLNVEAQAPDVTEARVAALRAALPASTKLEFGIGLESANKTVARYSVNKEFFLEDFQEAARAANARGATLKCYTMLKPPFLTEEEAIEDAVATAKLAGPHASTVSFNPMNIQKNTLVEDLWKRGQYRPPWLWSVVEALVRGKEACPGTVMKSDPVAGGKNRGAHNCGKCDEHVLKAIAAFNVSQDKRVFGQLRCECQQAWRDQLATEALFQGAYPDLRDEWAGVAGTRPR